MVVAILTLALLAVAFAVPNYLAVRYAVFGGAPGAPATVGAVKGARRSGSPAFARRGYLWKALSPLIFAVSIIVGLGLGGAVGAGIVALAALNLAFGLIGWDAFRPGRK